MPPEDQPRVERGKSGETKEARRRKEEKRGEEELALLQVGRGADGEERRAEEGDPYLSVHAAWPRAVARDGTSTA